MARGLDTDFFVEVALEPETAGDREKLDAALKRLVAKDNSLRTWIDLESGQAILGGASELDLDRAVGRLIAEGVMTLRGAPMVGYRETLGRKAEIDYTHTRQTGDAVQFARVKLMFEPGEPGSGYAFENKIVGRAVPEECVLGVEKGLEAARETGLLAGFPMIDFKAALVDGAYHEEDSSALTFEIAARGAFRELRDKGSPMLLEPIMKVEVATPADCVRWLVQDLFGRRAEVLSVDDGGENRLVTAMVPLGNMFGYAANLDAISQGRARYAMQFDHYGVVELEPPPGPFAPSAAMRA